MSPSRQNVPFALTFSGYSGCNACRLDGGISFFEEQRTITASLHLSWLIKSVGRETKFPKVFRAMTMMERARAATVAPGLWLVVIGCWLIMEGARLEAGIDMA